MGPIDTDGMVIGIVMFIVFVVGISVAIGYTIGKFL